MKPTFSLVKDHFNTSFAPLCVLGQALFEHGKLDLLRDFAAISMKTCDHTVGDKLLDAFLVILAGYPSLYMLNTKLRVDPMLASAWRRNRFADQSAVSRTLDAFTDEALAALQATSYGYWLECTRLTTHDWRKQLTLDLDLTPLQASKRAEGSTKGYIGKKNATGRQLARVMIHPYHESLLSQLYPGNQHSSNCLIPAVSAFENMLSLPIARHAKIVWRLDRGFGSDANINWLLERNYGVIAKGHSTRRSADLVNQVKRWRAVRHDKFVGCVPTPPGLGRPLHTFSIRYATANDWKHAYLFSTLNLSAVDTISFYDQRGGAETEFRSDKSGGLNLHKRRKHKRDAQEAWILLTDMAHNCLSWVAHTIFTNSPFAQFGFLRITRDLFSIPGHVEIENGQLVSAKFLKSSPYASDLLDCLKQFWN